MNRESVKQLLVSEYQGLLTLLSRKARDPQLAADMLNDALVVTLKNFDEGRIADPSLVGGYVFQVAMNLLRNHRRSFAENVNKRAELSEDAIAVVPAASEGVERDWAERVRQLVEELPAGRDRVLLKRFYLDEEEKSAICEQMQLSPLKFDKIIFRARKRMASLLEARGLRKGDFLSFVFGTLVAA